MTVIEWWKAFYEAFGLPHPRLSLIVAACTGAILFGTLWHVTGSVVKKDLVAKHVFPKPQTTGDATTNGDKSPAISGHDNSVTYGQNPPDNSRRK